ncbi:DUF3025 domain-containing protein [Caenimonas koreensis]|nr:DUF3025 domain-containing protein [Caenimonas koreensis]
MPSLGIDWATHWFTPWRGPGERIAQMHGQGIALHEALAREPSAPLQFVAQDELPAGEAYEAFILRTNRCPTRDNLHDFFNALVWLKFPLAKRRLNALHGDQLRAVGCGGEGTTRGPVRDAMTVFDENGALLHAPALIWQALVARDWQRLFIDLRSLWAETRIVLFGHALLEKMASPRKEITAHVWCADAPASAGDDDAWLAAQLTHARLAEKPFTPLPLSGVPGWHPCNSDISFYDDRLVFRPAGRQNQMTTVRPEALRP